MDKGAPRSYPPVSMWKAMLITATWLVSWAFIMLIPCL